jgi:hypothetical protein
MDPPFHLHTGRTHVERSGPDQTFYDTGVFACMLDDSARPDPSATTRSRVGLFAHPEDERTQIDMLPGIQQLRLR